MTQEYEDDYDRIAHTLQYGSPEEAAQALRDRDRGAVDREELARSTKALDQFRADHPDITGDDAAEAVVERKIFNGYLEDLRNAGFDESQIPPNLNAIAGLHLKLRAQGHPKVRKIDEVFRTAKEQYDAWRGGASSGPVSHHVHGALFGSDAEGRVINESRSRAVENMRFHRLQSQGRGTVDPRITPARR